jgi:hypothetical protein
MIDEVRRIERKNLNRHKKLIDPFINTMKCQKKIDPVKIIENFKP